MNRVNAEKLAAYLDRVPGEEFTMRDWCGTACCIDGHAQRLFGKKSYCPGDSVELELGLSPKQRSELTIPNDFGKPCENPQGPWDWWLSVHPGKNIYDHSTSSDGARAVRRAIELWCTS